MKSTQFFLAFLTLILCSQILSAQEKSENDKIMVLCCDSVIVTYEIVDCCVKLYMLNEHCDDSRFEIDQISTLNNISQYYNKGVLPANKGDVVTFTLCPDASKTVNFRVRIYRDNVSSCHPGFVEGWNQFSDTIDLSYCCVCDEENNDDWLIADLIASDDCPDGCKVKLRLNLGPNTDCYRYYTIVTPYIQLQDVPIDVPLSNYDYCLSPGETDIITFALQIDSSNWNEDPCEISQTITCDTTSYYDTLTTICKPDCFDDEWINPPLKSDFALDCSPGCSVHVEFTYRFACGNFQDLQILKMIITPSSCVQLCSSDSIYRETLHNIIIENKMRFHPRNDEFGCDYTWRIFNGSCWATWIDSVSFPGYLFL